MFEYIMSKEMADFLLKQRKGEDKKSKQQEYLRKVVNTEFGIKGICSKVTIHD